MAPPQAVQRLSSCSIYGAGSPITHLHQGQAGETVTTTYLPVLLGRVTEIVQVKLLAQPGTYQALRYHSAGAVVIIRNYRIHLGPLTHTLFSKVGDPSIKMVRLTDFYLHPWKLSLQVLSCVK